MRLNKSFIIFVFSVILMMPCSAKNVLPLLQPIKENHIGDTLTPMMKNDKWGFANPDGKFLIKPLFEEAKEYSDGYAYIKYGGKWGIINTTPAYVVNPMYDDIESFGADLDIVSKDGKYGIIKKSGQVRLPVEYDKICQGTYFPNITFACKDSLWDFVDSSTGMLKYKMGYADVVLNDGPYAEIKKGDKWGLMNKEIKYVSPIAYDYLKYHKEGYYIVQQNGLYGAINTKGEYILPCEFTQQPQISSQPNIFLANGKTYLASTTETHCWVLSYNYSDPRTADLAITSASSLIEQDLDEHTKLAVYDNVPAYITYDGKCVWAANDNIKRQISGQISFEYKEDSVQITNYFRANKNDDFYSMVQEIDIKYPASAIDFRFPVAKIQKKIFNLCTNQDLVTPTKVAEYYIGGYHIGYCEDYNWVPIPQLQVSLAKNQWKSSLHASIMSVNNGVMDVKVVKTLNFGDTQPNLESTIYHIDMKSGDLLSKD